MNKNVVLEKLRGYLGPKTEKNTKKFGGAQNIQQPVVDSENAIKIWVE